MAQRPLLQFYDHSTPVPPQRARTMSRIRGKDTKPELMLRRELWRRGFRYRIHDRSLPGTPDVSNKSRKIAIFVDGCFWHGCPEHFRPPKTRTEFWAEKIRRNRAKRKNVNRSYSPDWLVESFFECELTSGAGLARALEPWGRHS